MTILVIDNFPIDLMTFLGVEEVPREGLIRAPACPAVFVTDGEGTAGWWKCHPGQIMEKAAFRKRRFTSGRF